MKQQGGTSRAPDVLDIGMAVALANTTLFAPYEVTEWSDIPSTQKDANGLWYQDYGGYMSIGYDFEQVHDHVGPGSAQARIQRCCGPQRQPDPG